MATTHNIGLPGGERGLKACETLAGNREVQRDYSRKIFLGSVVYLSTGWRYQGSWLQDSRTCLHVLNQSGIVLHAPYALEHVVQAEAAHRKLEARLAVEAYPLDYSTAMRVIRNALAAVTPAPVVVAEGANTMDNARCASQSCVAQASDIHFVCYKLTIADVLTSSNSNAVTTCKCDALIKWAQQPPLSFTCLQLPAPCYSPELGEAEKPQRMLINLVMKLLGLLQGHICCCALSMPGGCLHVRVRGLRHAQRVHVLQ